MLAARFQRCTMTQPTLQRRSVFDPTPRRELVGCARARQKRQPGRAAAAHTAHPACTALQSFRPRDRRKLSPPRGLPLPSRLRVTYPRACAQHDLDCACPQHGLDCACAQHGPRASALCTLPPPPLATQDRAVGSRPQAEPDPHDPFLSGAISVDLLTRFH